MCKITSLFIDKVASKSCDAILTGESGSLSSPNYPNYYENYQDCSWFIEINGRENVELTLTDFDLEDEKDCRFDRVVVR